MKYYRVTRTVENYKWYKDFKSAIPAIKYLMQGVRFGEVVIVERIHK